MSDWEQLDDWRRRRLEGYVNRGLIAAYQPETTEAAFFVAHQLLVATSDLPQVSDAIAAAGGERVPDNGVEFPSPPTDLRPTAAAVGTDAARRFVTAFAFPAAVDVVDLARTLRDQHRRSGGRPVSVTPNHVAVSFQHRIGWPDGDPSATGRAAPSIAGADRTLGRGVRVAVVDTGFPAGRPPTCDWFTTATDWASRPGEQSHVDDLDRYRFGGGGPDGLLDAEAGHGVFVGGLVRRVAPGLELHFVRVLDPWGVGTEAGVIQGITQAAGRSADIINLSLGFYALDNLANTAMLTAVHDAMAQNPGSVVIAAAGNEGLVTPAFPAAYKDVVAVGALDGTTLRATSNRGWWVDVYAPGSDLQSAYVNGTEDVRLTLDGVAETFTDEMASWSGTSFACAMFSGAVAAELSRRRATGCFLTPYVQKLASSSIGEKLGIASIAPTPAGVAHDLVRTSVRAPDESGSMIVSVPFAV